VADWVFRRPPFEQIWGPKPQMPPSGTAPLPPSGTVLAQLVTEFVNASSAPAESAQLVVEALRPVLSPNDLAQLITDLLRADSAPVVEAQLVVEVLSRVPDWVNIANWEDIPLKAADFPDGRAHVNVVLWTGNAGVGIRARLWNVTSAVEMVRSSAVVSTTPVDVVMPVVLTAADAEYRVQVRGNRYNTDLFAMAQLVGGAAP
jgi:hypothetical protein